MSGTPRPVSDRDREFARRYQNGETGSDIAKTLGVNRCAVYYSLRKTGVATRGSSTARTKSGINHQYFSEIDDPEKAYLFGFLMADGYNCRRKGIVRLGIHEKDEAVLEHFRECLGTATPIRHYRRRDGKTYSYLNLCSKRISEDLERHGMVQAKTFTMTFPHLQQRLIPPFLRGYFDGDGSFSGARNPQFAVTSNRTFLTSYQGWLAYFAEISRTKFSVRHKDSPDICTMVYGGRHRLRDIYNVIYSSGAFWLDRKRDAMDRHLGIPHEGALRVMFA